MHPQPYVVYGLYWKATAMTSVISSSGNRLLLKKRLETLLCDSSLHLYFCTIHITCGCYTWAYLFILWTQLYFHSSWININLQMRWLSFDLQRWSLLVILSDCQGLLYVVSSAYNRIVEGNQNTNVLHCQLICWSWFAMCQVTMIFHINVLSSIVLCTIVWMIWPTKYLVAPRLEIECFFLKELFFIFICCLKKTRAKSWSIDAQGFLL